MKSGNITEIIDEEGQSIGVLNRHLSVQIFGGFDTMRIRGSQKLGWGPRRFEGGGFSRIGLGPPASGIPRIRATTQILGCGGTSLVVLGKCFVLNVFNFSTFLEAFPQPFHCYFHRCVWRMKHLSGLNAGIVWRAFAEHHWSLTYLNAKNKGMYF